MTNLFIIVCGIVFVVILFRKELLHSFRGK